MRDWRLSTPKLDKLQFPTHQAPSASGVHIAGSFLLSVVDARRWTAINEMAQGTVPWARASRFESRVSLGSPGDFGTRRPLFAQAEPGDRGTIALDIFLGEVGQQASPLSHELEQTASRMEVMPV